ncbi:unnamed protein product, partial [Staurois parvus]
APLYRASSCCCQARRFCHGPLSVTDHLMLLARPRNLSWAPVPPPHAAARSRVGVIGVPVRPLPIAAVSIATLCHVATFRSFLTLLCWVPIFVIGCCMALPIAAASTATLWLPHSGLAPSPAP